VVCLWLWGQLVSGIMNMFLGGGLIPVNLTISSDTANYNLFTAASSPAYPVAVTLTINSSIYVYSNSTASYALEVSNSWAAGSTITIANSGIIAGAGGNGGVGAVNAVGGNGNSGGPALHTPRATTITGAGSILGGGGGGGAGGGFYDGGSISGAGASGGGGRGKIPGNGGASGGIYGAAGQDASVSAAGGTTSGGTTGLTTSGTSAAGGNSGAVGGTGSQATGIGSLYGGGTGGAAGNSIVGIANVLSNSNTTTGPTS